MEVHQLIRFCDGTEGFDSHKIKANSRAFHVWSLPFYCSHYEKKNLKFLYGCLPHKGRWGNQGVAINIGLLCLFRHVMSDFYCLTETSATNVGSKMKTRMKMNLKSRSRRWSRRWWNLLPAKWQNWSKSWKKLRLILVFLVTLSSFRAFSKTLKKAVSIRDKDLYLWYL